MIGGNSGPFSFDRAAGERLARQASALANARGGSLLVSTSARTQPPAVDAFMEAVSRAAHIYRWQKGDPDNPYFAFLGLASEIVVTGDSMSMLAEACATHKRVHIFDLGEGRYAMREFGGNGRTPGEERPAVVEEPGKGAVGRLLVSADDALRPAAAVARHPHRPPPSGRVRAWPSGWATRFPPMSHCRRWTASRAP